MKKDVEEMLPLYVADLAHHVLVPIIETGPVKVWRMKRPGGGSINMVEIILTSLGIIIHGDQHPTEHPVHARKGLDWFVSQLDSGYLASKFLRKQYTPQAARRHVEWCMESLKERLAELGCEGLDVFLASDASGKAKLKASALHGTHTSLEEALERGEGLDNEFSYQVTFAPILEEHDTDTDWLYPNQEYRPEDETLLAAIQQRFRALFWERYDKIAPDGVLRLRHAPPPAVDDLIKRLDLIAVASRLTAEMLGHHDTGEATEEANALEGAVALIKAKAAPYPGAPIREAMLAALGETLHENPFATGIFRQLETAHEGQIPGIIAAGVQSLVANNACLMSMVFCSSTLSPIVPLEVRARALPMFPVEVALPAHGVKVLMRRGDWFVVANRQPGNSEVSPLGRWSWPAGEAAEISERIEKGDRWCHLMDDLPPCATEHSAARTDAETAKETT